MKRVKFKTLIEAEECLKDYGWHSSITGHWRNQKQPGLVREIRRPNNAYFEIFEWGQSLPAKPVNVGGKA